MWVLAGIPAGDLVLVAPLLGLGREVGVWGSEAVCRLRRHPVCDAASWL